MLKFFRNGTITESTLITGIKLQDNHDHLNPKNITVTQFKGATVVDPNLGNYVVLDFTVTDATALDIDHIILMSSETAVADSADKQLRIVKEAGKNLKIRLAAQFEGAEHCKFNTTSVNLPYATSFRDGVVRFANVTTNYGDTGWNITDNEENKSGTVYSADVVDKKINKVTDSLGNLDQYAKKAEPNEFTAANTFTAGITVNGEIGGTAVTDAGADGDKHIVNVGYADNKYLSKEIADATYLTKNDAGTTYLTKTEAGNTYLKQTDAADTYLSKTDAANYAKLNVGNAFTGATNTFNEVSATKFSGNGIVKSITDSTLADAELIPTDGAVKNYVDSKTDTLVQTITTLHNKDNDLQTQIDGINAGQNLADIVNSTAELAIYDISHLKAKGDFQHGAEGATWAIGDKVQVLGGGDVQSSVYELTKGDMPEDAGNIAATQWAGYYWRYIGVYGTNAYTKAEIDTKVNTINSTLGTKADKSYVDTELAKKADKDKITTTISDATATDENIPSASAVKTYVDTVANDLPNKYVTVDTTQEITGAKTFANGNITIANPNTDHKDKHYVTIGAAGNNTTSDYTSSIMHYDFTHNDYAKDIFKRARPNADPNKPKSSDNASYTRDLTRYDTNAGKYTFCSRIEQLIGTHYNYTASDMYMTTGDPDNAPLLPAAQIGTPGNTGSTDSSLKENYVERIRLRKNTSTVDNVEGGFLSAGTSVTDIDLFADNINNVFSKEVSFRVCTTSGEGVKTDKSVLSIHSSEGITVGSDGAPANLTVSGIITGNAVSSNISEDAPNNGTKLPTCTAVTTFVDNAITENQNATSNKNKVGAMGLFLYTGNDSQEMGATVSGTSLQAVGMQLPMDGVVSWSQGATMEGQWKLLNNTIAGEPCLVLAIRVG